MINCISHSERNNITYFCTVNCTSHSQRNNITYFLQSFEKIDKYIGRIAKHVPENSLFSVVLSGHPESQDTSNQAKCFVKIAGVDSNAGGK